MMRTLYVNADDFGLSRGINESIIAAIDHGVVNSVSILANGEDLDYAIAALRARPHVRVVAHLNLTEGPALLHPDEIAPLVDSRGMFSSSAASLWLRYLMSTPGRRRTFRDAIGKELRAQYERIRGSIEARAVDGHQHVHMLPFIQSPAISLGINHLRTPDEPLYFVSGSLLHYLGMHALGRTVLSILSRKARVLCDRRNIKTNESSHGILFSGTMTYAVVAAGLRTIASLNATETEVIVHPGSAREGEMESWRQSRANIAWHYDANRKTELEMLQSPETARLAEEFRNGTLPSMQPIRLARYLTTGSLATGLVLGLLYVCTEWAHIWYVLSAAFALLVSIVFSYLLQKNWTFADPRPFRIRRSRHSLRSMHSISVQILSASICVSNFFTSGTWPRRCSWQASSPAGASLSCGMVYSGSNTYGNGNA